jgi:spore germination cell wall hydrolase CwlJ-like protein
MPNSIAHQDLAALIARQPAVTERWRAHVRNSTFGTLHTASLSFPRVVGASIPDPFFTQLAALDPRALEATGSIPLNVPIDPIIQQPTYDFPVVERRLKGDRLKMQGEPQQPEPRHETAPHKKDMASRPPSVAPLLREQAAPPAADTAPSQAVLPKGDRLAPAASEAAAAAPATIHRRAGIAAGQDTMAKRMLGTAPRRQPVVIAAPAKPVEGQVLRRAGIAAGQDTMAKRMLGTAPRRQPVVIAAPAKPVEDQVLRRAGIAAGQDTSAKRVLGTGPRQQPIVVAAPAEPVEDQVLRRAGIAAGQDTMAKRVLGTAPRQQPMVIATPAEPVEDQVLRRAGIVAGQDTTAKRVLGTAPRRQPVMIAAPGEPVEDQVLRRAGIAAGQDTIAKRSLGTGPRQPVVIAAPAEPVADKVMRRAGLAATHLRQAKAEARRARAPFAETADLESARADLRGPVAPKRQPLPDTADLESARADLAGPIVPPPAPAPQVAEIASDPAAAPAVAVQPAHAPPVAEIVSAAPAKTPDRFNKEAAEQLAQFGRPSAQTRVFFGTRELGIGRNHWEAWEPEEIPTVLAPPHVDTEIKRAALDPIPDAETEKGGETIAPKGEVTGEGKRPRTAAERLNLTGASRVKHQKCLANAIYFEARGEVERGQMAVAQVILNRAFSGYYPGNVCDVVYQNAHRHLACQFTFACDNHKDVVRDQPRWEIADRIASEALDGKFWLPEVGKATHYHATYVNPWWVRTMTKHTRLGVHIFYRPTRWGALDEIPVWGDRLDVTGSIKREASPAAPAKGNDDKRADVQPVAAPARRSIFDPVEPINLPCG